MKKYCFLALLFFVGLTASAQIKGVVKDSTSGLPIPYVSIWVENEHFAATAEENGEFSIETSKKSKNLVFSAMGFERKTVAIANASEVKLNPSALQLDEIVISNRKETKLKEIGKSENQIHEAFENAPRIDVKFFPYLPEYGKTKFLKQVAVVTDSKIEGASFKIHLYGVDANGNPGAELLDKDWIVSVGKGILKTKFSLAKFNLALPKEGIFIGFEKLMIARNKTEKITVDPNTQIEQIQTRFYPIVLYDYVQRDAQFVFDDGKWIAKTKPNPDGPNDKIRIYEPAITLILTN